MCQFFLGTHQPHWLRLIDVPLFVSRRRFHRCKKIPRAKGPWAIDSGGFSELDGSGRWSIAAAEYVSEVRRWQEAGNVQWAAIMDWMCEERVLKKTGLTVAEHQKRTIASYFELRQLAPEIPWIPVLQGWHYDDYLGHLDAYEAAGADLDAAPVVGLGSVCRRQNTDMAEALIRDLHSRGLRLHGFGFKVLGLPRVAQYLQSADSLAWSYRGKNAWRHEKKRLCGHEHKGGCANCLPWALQWRAKVVGLIQDARAKPCQLTLY